MLYGNRLDLLAKAKQPGIQIIENDNCNKISNEDVLEINPIKVTNNYINYISLTEVEILHRIIKNITKTFIIIETNEALYKKE